jgi:hypothetical protein
MMAALSLSEMSVLTIAIWRNIQEDGIRNGTFFDKKLEYVEEVHIKYELFHFSAPDALQAIVRP